MIYNSLDARLLGRLVLLVAALAGGGYAALHHAYGLALGTLGLLFVLVLDLARYLMRGQQALADFTLALRYRDFSRQYPVQSGPASLRPLHEAFNQVNAMFQELRAAQEGQFHYLQTILALLDTGIVSYDAAGNVAWVNEAFKQTLHLPYLKNIRALQSRLPVLYEAICRAVPGQPVVVKLTVGLQTVQLLVSATQFKLRGEAFTLLAFKNVSQTLADTETAAWQQLLRVMTHEIMNSVAPIASLADSLGRHIQSAREQKVSSELLNDVGTGIRIIQQRSEGLLRFAQVYRDFSTLASPQRTTLYVQELLQATRQLLGEQLAAQGIEVTLSVRPVHLTLHADGHLLEQVLINLVLNAAQALAQIPDPRLSLLAWHDEQERVIIEVKDNGSGIPADVLDSIFIPFFTTYPNGSGIGLSLAKQIMQLHQGSIQVHSVAGAGSAFQLWFPPSVTF
ncbi:Histidine kinase-, DNA gyrase B-, and HSP90-like ATPase [Hymenobacter gelipurpurascens]|uniref:histidine kinase n=1 Tax=Hymenobacter gelipurpurascens TaxID=89968 RepID=A0A212UHE9_9BACT|nr:ATP-binding protein [Hymenobacter gelipurpurascens]SNC77591.1 Histidine kinase-, DNA gyrase B-, and HSP90-like ATPase [Hymenobacter gelipurpurascens]